MKTIDLPHFEEPGLCTFNFLCTFVLSYIDPMGYQVAGSSSQSGGWGEVESGKWELLFLLLIIGFNRKWH